MDFHFLRQDLEEVEIEPLFQLLKNTGIKGVVCSKTRSIKNRIIVWRKICLIFVYRENGIIC